MDFAADDYKAIAANLRALEMERHSAKTAVQDGHVIFAGEELSFAEFCQLTGAVVRGDTLGIFATECLRLDGLTAVGGGLALSFESPPLPNLCSITGGLSARRFMYVLNSLRVIGGDLDVKRYDQPLRSLRIIGGDVIDPETYRHLLRPFIRVADRNKRLVAHHRESGWLLRANNLVEMTLDDARTYFQPGGLYPDQAYVEMVEVIAKEINLRDMS